MSSLSKSSNDQTSQGRKTSVDSLTEASSSENVNPLSSFEALSKEEVVKSGMSCFFW
jgi:hypothetical protein